MPKKKHEFLDILRALNRSRVRYLVAGGVAVILHGVPRTTQDIDIYLDLEQRNILRAIRSLERLGFRPIIPEPAEALADPRRRRVWIREKNMLVFCMKDPGDPLHPVDIFLKHAVPFSSARDRAKVIRVEGTRVPLMSIRDLIVLKKKADREQDRHDIRELRKL